MNLIQAKTIIDHLSNYHQKLLIKLAINEKEWRVIWIRSCGLLVC